MQNLGLLDGLLLLVSMVGLTFFFPIKLFRSRVRYAWWKRVLLFAFAIALYYGFFFLDDTYQIVDTYLPPFFAYPSNIPFFLWFLLLMSLYTFPVFICLILLSRISFFKTPRELILYTCGFFLGGGFFLTLPFVYGS